MKQFLGCLIRHDLAMAGFEVVIPPRKKRVDPAPYDRQKTEWLMWGNWWPPDCGMGFQPRNHGLDTGWKPVPPPNSPQEPTELCPTPGPVTVFRDERLGRWGWCLPPGRGVGRRPLGPVCLRASRCYDSGCEGFVAVDAEPRIARR